MTEQHTTSVRPKISSPVMLALKGMAMGIAEVIPGVSGGTIAFITGIYERILLAIRDFDLVFLKLLFTGKFREIWNRVDHLFLLLLLGGMACGVVAGVFGVTHLMETYPEVLWAFFFGLIVASAWYVGRQVKEWSIAKIAAVCIGIIVAYMVTVISPVEGSTNLLYVMLSGLLAICALMLPGVSGSFVLLLLGMYTVIIGSVKDILMGAGMDKLVLISCFIVGMVVGVVSFSRVLTWMFRQYHMLTLALLSGFMIGALPKIWPWRIPVRWLGEDGSVITSGTPGEHAKILAEKQVLPGDYFGDPHTTMVIVSFILGFLLILAASYFEKPSARKGATT